MNRPDRPIKKASKYAPIWDPVEAHELCERYWHSFLIRPAKQSKRIADLMDNPAWLEKARSTLWARGLRVTAGKVTIDKRWVSGTVVRLGLAISDDTIGKLAQHVESELTCCTDCRDGAECASLRTCGIGRARYVERVESATL